MRNEIARKQSFLAAAAFAASFIVLSLVLLPVTRTQAAGPTSGTVAPVVGTSVAWTGTAPGGASPEGEATCVDGVNCDTYTLNVSGTPEEWAGKKINVKIAWALPASDYDFYIHKGPVTGPEVNRSGEAPPVVSEDADIDPSTTGTGVYSVRVVYWAASGTADQYRGTATVEAISAGPEPTPPPVSTAQPPTYDNIVPPSTLGQRAGEPTIGINWKTGNAMFITSLQTLRVTFNDSTARRPRPGPTCRLRTPP